MLYLLARFCARPFWRAQIFNSDVINSNHEAVLANPPFNPVGEVSTNPQSTMQCSGTHNIGFTLTDPATDNRNNVSELINDMMIA